MAGNHAGCDVNVPHAIPQVNEFPRSAFLPLRDLVQHVLAVVVRRTALMRSAMRAVQRLNMIQRSTGSLALFQEWKPPFNGVTLLKPASSRTCATRALSSSLSQVQ